MLARREAEAGGAAGPSPSTRVLEWAGRTPGGLALSALGIGLGAGLGAIAFRYLILWFTILFTGHEDYAAAGRAPNPHLPWLGAWFVALAPVVGGLLYGPLTDRFAREARGHGVPEVMYAVSREGGRIRPRVAVVKALASALCIGAGGSVGREGPIVQIGAALGSSLGQFLRVPASRLSLLVACGAAGGISATFNAPIAGVLFALELILGRFEAGAFAVVVLSSVGANVLGRAAFGSRPFLALPPFTLGTPAELLPYALLGVLGALAGVAFVRTLYGLEDAVDRVWRGPEGLRPAVGGVALGLLLLALPQMYGVGYPVVERAIGGGYAFWLLLLLLGGKILATSLTIAIGGSGGVFAPSLFMGAMLGTAFGQGLHGWLPSAAADPGAYGLVGMGAVFAAAARAPLTSAVIVVELTGQSSAVLPLLVSIAVATGVANLLERDTIYTLKLRRRGVDILGDRRADPWSALTVREAMERGPAPLRPADSLRSARERFAREAVEELPVADEDGSYRGIVAARAVEEAAGGPGPLPLVGSLARLSPTVKAGESLGTAVAALLPPGGAGVPVLEESGKLVGWLTPRGVRCACRDRREKRAGAGEGDEAAPQGGPGAERSRVPGAAPRGEGGQPRAPS